jgi:nitroreductase
LKNDSHQVSCTLNFLGSLSQLIVLVSITIYIRGHDVCVLLVTIMDVIEAIATRRSIRRYKRQTPISDEMMHTLLDAGFSAPSAGNQQPWHFLVIDDHKLLTVIQTFHPSAKMLTEADKAILVCGDLNLEKFKGYWMIDCAAATENILLAAHGLGLGSCWLGIYPREGRVAGMKKLFHLPHHIIPLAVISLGYPAEEKPRETRYTKERVHHNTW